MSSVAKGSLEFRPMQGFLSLADRAAQAIGLKGQGWWDGDEGLRVVIERKLSDMGVPDQSIPLTGEEGVSPLRMAEHAGFIKKRKRIAKK
jgi:hypothetical protein